jgi:hypothetical protein
MQTHAKVKNVKFCDGSCTVSVNVWKRKFYVQTKIFNIIICKILIVLFAVACWLARTGIFKPFDVDFSLKARLSFV